MMARYIKLFAGLVAAAISAVSCVYPFNPEIEDSDETLVMEGDILLGEECTFTVSYTGSFAYTDDSSSSTYLSAKHPQVNIWVEDSDGNKYEGEEESQGIATVNLKTAPTDKEYRLCVYDKDNGRTYHSEFKSSLKAAEIDSLSYTPQKDKNRLAIGLSMHTAGSHYFKWSYSEVWEYHAHYYSQYKYIVENARLEKGHIEPYADGENIYYCWGSRNSSEIMIFSTADQTEDRFVDLEFHTIPRNDQRIMSIYYIEVYLEPMDETGYKYWNNVKTCSENNGGFFSATPSQMTGNIVCEDDPSEFIIGYINVAQRSKKHMFYYNDKVFFYESSTRSWPEEVTVETGQEYAFYRQGYWPVEEVFDETSLDPIGYAWAPSECVDCRRSGGTKNRPAWWPSLHY